MGPKDTKVMMVGLKGTVDFVGSALALHGR